MFGFEKLDVWKRSLHFADAMFTVADGLPKRYQFSLGDQLRRASLSVPTNIAEGSGRQSSKEQAYFYNIAKEYMYEVVSLLALIGKRGHLTRENYQQYHQEADEIAAMLNGLVKAARSRAN